MIVTDKPSITTGDGYPHGYLITFRCYGTWLHGDARGSFPFDHAHRRTYRWGEDGLAGLTDRFGFLNLAVALWNGRDDRLKERLFGLTNPQGNHGEDVKEYWWPLDATPTHSFASWLYRYPQAAFPYDELVARNAERGFGDREFELADTGVLAGDRFFDVVVSHAKSSSEDICVMITATNHGPDPAPLHIVPQLWFRNTWAWGRDDRMPSLRLVEPPEHDDGDLVAIEARHGWLIPPLRRRLARSRWPGTDRAEPALLRQRDQRPGAVGHRGAQRIPEGRCEPGRRPRRPLSAQPGRARDEGGAALRLR